MKTLVHTIGGLLRMTVMGVLVLPLAHSRQSDAIRSGRDSKEATPVGVPKPAAVEGLVLGSVPVLVDHRATVEKWSGNQLGTCERMGTGVVAVVNGEFVVLTARHVVDLLFSANAVGGGGASQPQISLVVDGERESVALGRIASVQSRVAVGHFAARPNDVLISNDSDLALLRFTPNELESVLRATDEFSPKLLPWTTDPSVQRGAIVIARGFSAGSFSSETELVVVNSGSTFLVCSGTVKPGSSGGAVVCPSRDGSQVVGVIIRSDPTIGQSTAVQWGAVATRLRAIDSDFEQAPTRPEDAQFALRWTHVTLPGVLPQIEGLSCATTLK